MAKSFKALSYIFLNKLLQNTKNYYILFSQNIEFKCPLENDIFKLL